MNIFDKIKNWAILFGLPVREKEQLVSLEETEFILSLIEEEKEEIITALIKGDLKEAKDGFGDLLWVTVRGMQHMGMDPLDTLEKIYVSNMSKADPDWDMAELTKNKYLKQGIVTYQKEFVSDGEKRICTYRQSDGKLLKSINFIEPEL